MRTIALMGPKLARGGPHHNGKRDDMDGDASSASRRGEK